MEDNSKLDGNTHNRSFMNKAIDIAADIADKDRPKELKVLLFGVLFIIIEVYLLSFKEKMPGFFAIALQICVVLTLLICLWSLVLMLVRGKGKIIINQIFGYSIKQNY